MEEISLHILDIAENAIRAKAKNIVIRISEDEYKDLLTICIKDDGEGMDKEMIKKALDPFFTTKNGKRVGLGLSLLSQMAQQAGGHLNINSEKGSGTIITATFRLSHPDTQPMGNIVETMATLIAGQPSIRFILDYRKGNQDLHFDSHEKH
jgi:signal transduction histidine kinase